MTTTKNYQKPRSLLKNIYCKMFDKIPHILFLYNRYLHLLVHVDNLALKTVLKNIFIFPPVNKIKVGIFQEQNDKTSGYSWTSHLNKSNICISKKVLEQFQSSPHQFSTRLPLTWCWTWSLRRRELACRCPAWILQAAEWTPLSSAWLRLVQHRYPILKRFKNNNVANSLQL